MKFEQLNLNMPGFDEIEIPKMIRVKQKFEAAHIKDIEREMKFKLIEAMNEGKLRKLKGKRIAITAGSRGIPAYKEMLRALCMQLKEFGAKPFIFPAMGSHMGGTSEGQKNYLTNLGITEDFIGAPVLSTMDTVVISELPNKQKIHCDKYAYEADGIIICHKIKPHPNFKGMHESGLLKMICIGVGKHQGAASFHEGGFDNFDKRLVDVSKLFLKKMNVVFGIGLCENAYDQLAKIEIIKTEEIIEKDTEMLEWARRHMPRLYLENIDELIIDEIGKEISGAGFDGNITGRNCESSQTAHLFKKGAPNIKRIALLDITEQSHGLAATMGVADLISMRLANKIDFEATYINLFTSKICTGASMPPYGNNDADTIRLGILTGVGSNRKNARVVRIKNTLCLEEIEVSVAFLEEVKLNKNIEILSEPYDLKFDSAGNLF